MCLFPCISARNDLIAEHSEDENKKFPVWKILRVDEEWKKLRSPNFSRYTWTPGINRAENFYRLTVDVKTGKFDSYKGTIYHGIHVYLKNPGEYYGWGLDTVMIQMEAHIDDLISCHSTAAVFTKVDFPQQAWDEVMNRLAWANLAKYLEEY